MSRGARSSSKMRAARRYERLAVRFAHAQRREIALSAAWRRREMTGIVLSVNTGRHREGKRAEMKCRPKIENSIDLACRGVMTR